MLQVFQCPDPTTGSKLKRRNEAWSMFCVLHKGRGWGYLFLAFITGIVSLLPLCREFNFYHLQHAVPFASFKVNEQNISPYEKETCHLFFLFFFSFFLFFFFFYFYTKAFIAGRDANSDIFTSLWKSTNITMSVTLRVNINKGKGQSSNSCFRVYTEHFIATLLFLFLSCT